MSLWLGLGLRTILGLRLRTILRLRLRTILWLRLELRTRHQWRRRRRNNRERTITARVVCGHDRLNNGLNSRDSNRLIDHGLPSGASAATHADTADDCHNEESKEEGVEDNAANHTEDVLNIVKSAVHLPHRRSRFCILAAVLASITLVADANVHHIRSLTVVAVDVNGSVAGFERGVLAHAGIDSDCNTCG